MSTRRVGNVPQTGPTLDGSPEEIRASQNARNPHTNEHALARGIIWGISTCEAPDSHQRGATAQRPLVFIVGMPTPVHSPFSRSSRELMPSVKDVSNTATGFVTNQCDTKCHKASAIKNAEV